MFENLGEDFYRIMGKAAVFLVLFIVYRLLMSFFRKRKNEDEEENEDIQNL